MPPKPAAKAAKRKGLSEEEKQDALLQFLHDSREPWTVKDLIKVVPKRIKGVSFKEVEPLVKALLGDDLMQQDKVGINTLVWSFPATAGVQRQQAVAKKQEELSKLDAQVTAAQCAVDELRKSRVDSAERTELLARHGALVERVRELTVALGKNEILTMDDLNALADEARGAAHAANAATDDLWVAVQHLATLRGVRSDEVLAGLDMPADLEYF